MNSIRLLVGVGAAVLALDGSAQQAGSGVARADPAAPLRYNSVFADYRGYTDVNVGNWRQLNDTVRQSASAGAHAGHTEGEPASNTPQQRAPSGRATSHPEPAEQGGQPHGARGGRQ